MTRLLKHLMADADGAERRTVTTPTDLKFVGPATADAVAAAPFSAQDIVDKDVSYRMLRGAGVNPGVAAKIRRHHSLSWSFDNDGDLDRRSEQVRGLKDEEAAWVASSLDDAEVETVHAGGIDADEVDAARAGESDDAEAAWVAESTVAGEAEPTGEDEPTDEAEDDEADSEADAETAWVDGATTAAAPATADGSGDPLAAEAAWRERSKPTPLTELSGVDGSDADRLAEAGVTSIRSLATASPELLSDVTGIEESRLRRWHRAASERAD